MLGKEEHVRSFFFFILLFGRERERYTVDTLI